MTNDVQTNIFNLLSKYGIKNFVGVPDSTLKKFIEEGLRQKKIIISTREEEAIGIAVGMTLSNSKSLVFMQNAGFANSLSTITSLVQLYKIPLIFLIGWRGYLKTDAPEHLKIGKIQKKLLKALDLQTKILTDENWEKNCNWATQKIKKNQSCVIIIRRMQDE